MSTLAARVYAGLVPMLNADSVELAVTPDSIATIMMWVAKGRITVNRKRNLARTFRLWALSDTHVGTEIKFGRRSLEEVIQHAEAWPNTDGQSGCN